MEGAAAVVALLPLLLAATLYAARRRYGSTADAPRTQHAPAEQAPAERALVEVLEEAVLIDACNVRASMGWPARDLFDAAIARWSAARPPTAVAVVVADGGGDHGAHALGATAMAVTSGPRWSADDVIMRDVRWCAAPEHSTPLHELDAPHTRYSSADRRWAEHGGDGVCLLVVTSDKLLRRRCRHAHGAVPSRSRLRFESAEAFGAGLHLRDTAEVPPRRRSDAASPADAAPLPSSDGERTGSSAALLRYAAHVASDPRPPSTAKSFCRAARR